MAPQVSVCLHTVQQLGRRGKARLPASCLGNRRRQHPCPGASPARRAVGMTTSSESPGHQRKADQVLVSEVLRHHCGTSRNCCGWLRGHPPACRRGRTTEAESRAAPHFRGPQPPGVNPMNSTHLICHWGFPPSLPFSLPPFHHRICTEHFPVSVPVLDADDPV